MNRFVVAISSIVSGRSFWLLIIFTGQAYTLGFSAIWALVGYLIVELFLFIFLAPKLKVFSEKHDCITIPDYFSARFQDNKGHLRLILSLIIVAFMIIFIAYLLDIGGKSIFYNFGLNQSTGVIVLSIFLLFFTLTGGFVAVGVSDILLAVTLAIVFLIIPVFTLIDFGGIPEFRKSLAGIDENFFSPLALSVGVLTGFLGIGLASPGNPHILVRYMSAKDPAKFRWIAFYGTAWSVVLAAGAFFCGIIARVYFPNIESIPGKDPANAFLTLSNAVLPAVLTGFVFASIFGSIISSASSHLLIATSSIIRDIYEKILRKHQDISRESIIFASRIALILIVYTAIVFTLFLQKIITGFMLTASAGLAASIGPVMILSIFWDKTTRNGVFSGLMAGMLTVILWKIIPGLSTLMFELIPGFFAGLIITILVSIIDTGIQKYTGKKKTTYKKVKNFKPDFNKVN